MTSAPAKKPEKKKAEKDNIFLDILYNIVVQTPILIISWIVSRFDWD